MKLVLNIEENLQNLLKQEDTDNDNKITVEDKGPKKFAVVTLEGSTIEIKGTYYLSNLLQELVLAKENGSEITEIDIEKIFEEPLDRINRMIKDYYWEGLTRKIDASGIKKMMIDSKAESNNHYLYVPFGDETAYKYFKNISENIKEINITVVKLPEKITPEYVYSINNKPGVLSLALKKNDNNEIEGVPFVVPGGRFNEMYGWDSYFESLGLIIDGKVNLAKAMADNFVYEINHYKQILNANRTYYLTRSQPPFLTSLALEVYKCLPKNSESKEWLKVLLISSIKEYKTVWMSEHKLTPTKLNRYFGTGIGLAPETELTHFDSILKPFAEKAGLSIREYHKRYLKRENIEPEIEEFIKHDRSIRESGHDTSYRLDKISANLNTVDLNSLLYKYEFDIAEAIKNEFDNYFISYDGTIENSETWFSQADERKSLINKLMWNEDKGYFFDYNFVTNNQTRFESATTFYPLWAKLATQKQADLLVKKALPILEFAGGVAGSSKESVGVINEERPQKQWDYPNGWAPHQILIWEGLKNYGYDKVAERLAYKWLYMILKNAVDYNGTIPEKYDVVSRTHKVFAEYGNVGTEFDYITHEGFGWMNASFKIGQLFLTSDQKQKLNRLIPPEIGNAENLV
ncbi:MAG: trehalase [Bacteroidetes bacterium]|nr:trehalase [Bacteroidota bacterium]MBU2506578.1 trehalase [Bacteroidota bacterium]